MTSLSVHPAYPTRQALLDAIAAARAVIADQDSALALLASGIERGAIPDADGLQMLGDICSWLSGGAA